MSNIIRPENDTYSTEVEIQESSENRGMNSRSITLRIRRAIECGTYANGDQLPPERELALTYAASRSTIRKALNNLEDSGLVVRKVGSGTYINYEGPQEPQVEDVIDRISPLQLIDARIGVERQMARLAVLNANRRDIEQMGLVLERMEASEHDRDEFSRWDTEFHLLLARGSANPLLEHLYEKINDVRTHAQWRAMKNVILTPSQIRAYNKCHRAIFVALSNRDTAAVIDAINAHMDLAREDLLGANSGV